MEKETTPDQKAKELVGLYIRKDKTITIEKAKDLANTSVEITLIALVGIEVTGAFKTNLIQVIEFWQAVKEEIKNL